MRQLYPLRNAILLLAIWLITISLSGCLQPRGIDLAIKNFTSSAYVLNVKINNQWGQLLYDLSIPLEPATQSASFNYYHEFDSEFEQLVVKTTLESVHKSEVVDSQIGFWPGKAGSANGASSNRILIQIGIVEQQGQVKANFMGLL
jgi:hypothetical protein